MTTSLPRGPHKLSREQVIASQRERLMRAMAEVTAAQGYAETSVADVLRAARVSRETFYQLFTSKQECFIAAYEQAAAAVLALLEAQSRSAARWPPLERFSHTLEVYLQALAAEPAYARLFMVEVYAAGDEVLDRRAEIKRWFEQLLIEGFGPRDATEEFACRALVAAIITQVTEILAARRPEELADLHAPFVDLVAAVLAGRPA